MFRDARAVYKTAVARLQVAYDMVAIFMDNLRMVARNLRVVQFQIVARAPSHRENIFFQPHDPAALCVVELQAGAFRHCSELYREVGQISDLPFSFGQAPEGWQAHGEDRSEICPTRRRGEAAASTQWP